MRTLAIALFALAGCIDEYQGSEVQLDFSTLTPIQASAFRSASSSELPSNIHFTLYAFDEMAKPDGSSVGRLFALQQFEIHRIVDLDSPCYIDVGEHVPFPGLHVSQYYDQVAKKNGITDLASGDPKDPKVIETATAKQRQLNIEAMAVDGGPKVISSASTSGYPQVATSCDDTSAIPPKTCVDDASNKRRLELCQKAWGTDKNFFEGTDRVLTLPLNGVSYGMVEGRNPVNQAPVGGSAFFIDEDVAGFDGYAIYWQYDDANHDGMPDYPASVPASERRDVGTLFLYGTPESPTRGVIRAHMMNYETPSITAELAIFANIDQDDVHF